MAIDLKSLKSERDDLKERLRDLDTKQRKLDTDQKRLRQQAIRAKRMIEALDTLIDVNEDQQESSENGETTAAQSP